MACTPGNAKTVSQENGATAPATPTSWPTEDEFVKRQKGQGGVTSENELARNYVEMIKRAVVSGEIDYQQAVELVGEIQARSFWRQHMLINVYRIPLDRFLADKVLVRENPMIERASYHREQVEMALIKGKPVPAEVLTDYPNLWQSEPPAWQQTADEWTQAECERLNAPLLRRGVIVRFSRQSYKRGVKAGQQVQKLLNEVQERQPEFEWVVDFDNPYGKTVDFVGRRPVRPDDLFQPAELVQRHHDAVESALREGKPVPPEVVMSHPDLVAKYGFAGT